VLVIAKDEAKRLPRFFEALRLLEPLAYEVVLLDSKSSDGTLALARKAKARVFQVAWQGYAATKNQGFARCRAPWILSLDADESLTPALAASIRQALESPAPRAWRLCRLNHFLGHPVRHGGWYPDWHLRLFMQGAARFNSRRVHEGMEMSDPGEPCGRLQGDLIHDSYPDLHGYFERLNRYTTLQAEELFERKGARPGLALARALFDPWFVLLKMLLLKRGFLDGGLGLKLAALSASSTFWKYAKWWHRSWEAKGGQAGVPWVERE
jgi:glycosyltransferase involved in cell wall biosynthesis